MERRIKMIKDIKIYSGPNDLEEDYLLIHLGGYILPVDEYKPSERYNKKLEIPVSKIIIGYPLSNKAEITVSGVKTMNDLLSDIVKGYQEVYRMEEDSTEKEASRMCDEIPGCSLINRGRTNGMFGIWGHFIDDLAIHTVYLHKNGYVTIGVDS